MLYDIKLVIEYDYAAQADRSRTLLRLMPRGACEGQEVLVADLGIDPEPDERREGVDYFGNSVTIAVWHRAIAALRLTLVLRARRDPLVPGADRSPPLTALAGQLAALRDLGADSPLHHIGPSPRIALSPPITAFAREATRGAATSRAAVLALGRALHKAMTFDAEATSVDTPPAQAFAQRRGVCQDFAQVMIAGLRGIGVPAGYVSGFLRTEPPPGKPRLEGVDAMHAWVRAWTGDAGGWLDIDPTNDQWAGEDYVTLARGRDYGDVAPVLGAFRTAGKQGSRQLVDVVPLEG